MSCFPLAFRARKVVKAQQLWFAILEAQVRWRGGEWVGCGCLGKGNCGSGKGSACGS